MTIILNSSTFSTVGGTANWSAEEVAFFQKLKIGELTVKAGAPIISEGVRSVQVYTVQSGFGLRSRAGVDGRDVAMNLIFPGDLIGLHADPMGEAQSSVFATSQMTLSVIDRAGLWDLFRRYPLRAFDLTWETARNEYFRGPMLGLSQRNARQVMSNALLQIYRRGELLGLVRDRKMPLPYRQQDMADSLGLSLVHTNKTLAYLKSAGVAQWSDGVLSVLDMAGLAQVARTA